MRVSRWLAAALQEGYRLCGCAGGAASLAAQADDCECLPDELYGVAARLGWSSANKVGGWIASVLPPLAAHLPKFGLPLWPHLRSRDFLRLHTDQN